MAIDQTGDPNQARDDEWLRPTFTASRFPAEEGLEPGLPRSGEWKGIGDGPTLSAFGLDEGQVVEADSYNRVRGGRNAATDEIVRDPNTLPRNLGKAKGVKTKEQGYMQGLVHLEGSLEAPQELAAEYRGADPIRKGELEDLLLDETAVGISRVARTERVAAVATVATEVGEGGEATVRVRWVAFGADRGDGVETPFDENGNKQIDKFTKESATRIGDKLATGRASAETTVEAAAASQVEVPAPRSASPAPAPALPRSELFPLPEKPLTDSLSAAVAEGKLGVEAARDIWRRGRDAAVSGDLGHLSEQDLRDGLPAENPFEQLPANPEDGAALSTWRGAAVRTAAIEGQLIDNACRAYEDLAKRESVRRNEVSPHPMRRVRQVRDARIANLVERDAAVRASELGSKSEPERQAMTAQMMEKIRPVGFAQANRDDLAELVGLQHCRNADNARARRSGRRR